MILVQDQDFVLHVGDACDVLRDLPDESVHCVVTSPPYWGLRDYGTGSWEGGDPECDHTAVRRGHGEDEKQSTSLGTSRDRIAGEDCRRCGALRVDRQLGLEATPEEYVENMVAVFREVRRVLRRDGTCWLNLGDSYAHSLRQSGAEQSGGKQNSNAGSIRKGFAPLPAGLKEKDLVGIPWRVAFALQQDGWYLRADIIWSKPNPMPESVSDRPTKAHEYVFLLTRSARYFYDADAIREAYTLGNMRNGFRGEDDGPSDYVGQQGPQNNSAKGPDGRRVTAVKGQDGSAQHRDGERWPNPSGRNKRSVWEIATEPYPDAHFATFPQALVEPCVLAGTSERGCCPECGAPWVRETARIESGWDGSRYGERAVDATGGAKSGGTERSTLGSSGGKLTAKNETVGWSPSCDHELEPVPCTILDIFMGSGTTALVARKHGRKSIGIELNAEYAQLAAQRLQQLSLLAEGAA